MPFERFRSLFEKLFLWLEHQSHLVVLTFVQYKAVTRHNYKQSSSSDMSITVIKVWYSFDMHHKLKILKIRI